ncbi:MAG TPA: magnesium/cobalt transporter CorA [Frankiaceae bacterium]|nr:magnesium/cobalt transporter CorA [Frankiaceae bacterium]
MTSLPRTRHLGGRRVNLRKQRPSAVDGSLAGGHGHSAENTVVDCALYVDGKRQQGRLPYEGALDAADHGGGFVWIGLYEPSDEQVEGLAEEFGLHPLAVEDAVLAHQRPKLEQYGDHWFVVLKTAKYIEHEELTGQSEIVRTGEIMLFVASNFIITVRHGSARPLHDIRQALERDEELVRCGPPGVLYKILDQVVDDYVDVTYEVEQDIDELEESVFSPQRTDDTLRIYQLKREVLEFKRAVVPLGRPMEQMLGTERLKPIHDYLRDVDDHLRRVTEQVEGDDELLDSILDANLTRVSVQQNDDMRKISAYAALFAVPTGVAGIYGMNFDHMPELHWAFGYPMALLIMVTLVSALYGAFKRSGWL